MGRRIITILFCCFYFLASGQNLQDIISNYNAVITYSSAELIPVAGLQDFKHAQWFSPSVSQKVEIAILKNEKYASGYALPPHADMIRLLGTAASNEHTHIQIQYESTEEGSAPSYWVADAHFSPDESISARYFGWLRTIYKEGEPLLHYFVFYDGEKSEMIDFLPDYRTTE